MEKFIGNRSTEIQATATGRVIKFGSLDGPAKESMEWQYDTKVEVGINTLNQDGDPGIMARTLHPTYYGHQAIAKIIVDQLKKDFVATQQPQSPESPLLSPALQEPSPSPAPQEHASSIPKNALSIVLEWSIPPTSDEATLKWLFYETQVGQSVVCRKHDDNWGFKTSVAPGDFDKAFPIGTFDIDLFGKQC